MTDPTEVFTEERFREEIIADLRENEGFTEIILVRLIMTLINNRIIDEEDMEYILSTRPERKMKHPFKVIMHPGKRP